MNRSRPSDHDDEDAASIRPKSIRAVIRSIWSPDVQDLATWRPDEEEWSVAVTIIAGPEGEAGEESFSLTVCSPEWIRLQTRLQQVFDGRHHLIVDGFDWPKIRGYLERRVSNCEGGTWSEVAEKLGRLGSWEFEDYEP